MREIIEIELGKWEDKTLLISGLMGAIKSYALENWVPEKRTHHYSCRGRVIELIKRDK